MLKPWTLVTLALIVGAISSLVWAPVQARTDGLYEVMVAQQQIQASPTTIPDLPTVTTQLQKEAQSSQTPIPEVTVITTQLQDALATPTLVPELNAVSETKVFLPLVMAKAAPKVTILFSDKIDTSGNLINPKTTFVLIKTLYWQARVTDAEGKQFRATIMFDNSAEFDAKTTTITNSAFIHSDALTTKGLFLPSVVIHIRVYLDGVLIKESQATIY